MLAASQKDLDCQLKLGYVYACHPKSYLFIVSGGLGLDDGCVNRTLLITLQSSDKMEAEEIAMLLVLFMTLGGFFTCVASRYYADYLAILRELTIDLYEESMRNEEGAQ